MSFEFVALWYPNTEPLKVPHSETILSCRDCFALGYIDCEFCSRLPMKCYECSKENSNKCDCCIPKQRKECKNCDGKGTLKCKTCEGRGRLLQNKVLHIQFKGYQNPWISITTRNISNLVETKRQVLNQTELLNSKIIYAESSSVRVPRDTMPPSCFENSGKSDDDFLKDCLVHDSRQSLHQIPINEIQFEIDQEVKSYLPLEP